MLLDYFTERRSAVVSILTAKVHMRIMSELLMILVVAALLAILFMDQMSALALFFLLILIGGGVTDALINNVDNFIQKYNTPILIILFIVAIIVGMIANGVFEKKILGVTTFLAAYPTILILYAFLVGVVLDSYEELGFALFLMFGWCIIIVDIVACAIFTALSALIGIGIPYLITRYGSGKIADIITLVFGVCYSGVLFYFAIGYVQEMLR